MERVWTQFMIMVQMCMVMSFKFCFISVLKCILIGFEIYKVIRSNGLLHKLISLHFKISPLLGLTCHPSRPFTMASCSRDSTVRLWSLTPLINPLQINIITDRCWDDIIGNTGKQIV